MSILSYKDARALQLKLAKKVIMADCMSSVKTVAGVDMAINMKNNHGRGAVVLMTYPMLDIIESHVHEEPLEMPYIPGLLSFREIPSILGAYNKLQQKPDLILVDGMGIAHPRRLGIASHLGLLINKPTIGCGKSLLSGHYDAESLEKQAGSWVPLVDKDEIIGAVVRTRTNIKPLFISLGHMISLQSSIEYVLACCKGYRLPEPVRQADKLSKIKN
jgi:deoxyribonuclease V